MSGVTMKQLLEAGVHFGHQTRRWNPKMKAYIFGARNGIYIIDLQKTVRLFKRAYSYVEETVASGGSILFVGTKKQAQDAIYEEATRAGQFYVNQRWLGGMLTNFSTIKQSIDRMNNIGSVLEKPDQTNYTKKELGNLKRQFDKLNKDLAGIRDMRKLPAALFIVDPKKENIAVKEANKLKIPIVGIVDTNCDPDEIDYIIPGNDDAIRAIRLFAARVADACIEGKSMYEASLKEDVGEAPIITETKPEEYSEMAQEEAAAAQTEAETPEKEQQTAEEKPEAESESEESEQHSAPA